MASTRTPIRPPSRCISSTWLNSESAWLYPSACLACALPLKPELKPELCAGLWMPDLVRVRARARARARVRVRVRVGVGVGVRFRLKLDLALGGLEGPQPLQDPREHRFARDQPRGEG